MYLTRFVIQNIRAIQKLEWEVPVERAPGWHVILGDNGSGKSTVLRSLALALVGPEEAKALPREWARWQRGEELGLVHLVLVRDPKLDKFRGMVSRTLPLHLRATVAIQEDAGQTHLGAISLRGAVSQLDPAKFIWGRAEGWFSASYGPFRRFTGGDAEYEELFDEVDAHLHPTWQRKVGLWFREHFPKLQFIVTTHSPLVCQAAEVGTVWRLPMPGTDEEPMQVIGSDLDRLIFGNVLEAYGTELFGKGVARSERSKQRLRRLAELNMKELRQGLSAAERKQQQALRASLPTTAMVLHDSEA